LKGTPFVADSIKQALHDECKIAELEEKCKRYAEALRNV
jgi:hypothetical protein